MEDPNPRQLTASGEPLDGVARWIDRVRRYPLPFFAIAGLAIGAFLAYAVGQGGAARWVWLVTLVVGGIPLVWHTVRRVLRGQFASDIIATLAIVAAIALDQAFAGVIIVLMQSSGEALDAFAFHRASSSLDQLLRRAPRRAQRRQGDAIVEIPVETVVVGDLLIVRSGDMIPVDGRVASGEALVDESTVTGEPLPVRRESGAHLLSGSVNVGGPFDLIAERVSGESQYARIVELVRTAQGRKPAIQRLADRYAVWFTPITVVVALGGWFLTQTPLTALAVLVVATPCPLIIATPIAVIGAVNRAADRGIVVKSGGAIEEVGRAKVVVFDKTGTITSGRPEVERIVPLAPSVAEHDLLADAATIEQFSSHPLALAVVREAKERGLRLPPPSELAEIPGAGMEGRVDGRKLLIGSASLVESRYGLDLAEAWAALTSATEVRGRLVSFVVADDRPIGAIVFADRLRPGVPTLVGRLGSLGVAHVVMLTGDRHANAQEIAHQAGLTEFEGELLPEEKVDRVVRFRKELGSTVMVGDGVNDAGALAAASVGIAMGAHGAGISTDAADVVLLVDDVSRVGDAVSLGQRMVSIARQGIIFGLGASGVLMVIAASGHVLPAIGAVLQELLDVAVIVNALRVR